MVLKYASIIDESTGQCFVSDKPFQNITTKKDVTMSELDRKWYLTEYLINDRAYQLKVLNNRKLEKYKAITDKYDQACKYGLADVLLVDKSYIANRSWLATWNEAITGLEYQQSQTKEEVTAFVRLYEKAGTKYRNITIENVTIAQYKALYLELISYRFNVLQPLRNSRYTAIEQATSIEDIDKISEDFGVCIDEQNDTQELIIT